MCFGQSSQLADRMNISPTILTDGISGGWCIMASPPSTWACGREELPYLALHQSTLPLRLHEVCFECIHCFGENLFLLINN